MDTTQATFSADDPECAICLGPFKEPKIMFCGHFLCRGCLITWVTAQRWEVFCPLCRKDVLDIPIINKTEDFISFEVDCLPTDHVIMATARGKHDVTPDTCSGCEGLLCGWRTAPHPQCPGQDVQNTEADARAAVKDLTDKVEKMIEASNKLQKQVRGMEAEAEFLVDMSKIEGEVQDRTRDSVSWLKTETGKLRCVPFTHQHLLQRMGNSHQVVATMLMKMPIEDRCWILSAERERDTETFHRMAVASRHSTRHLWIRKTFLTP